MLISVISNDSLTISFSVLTHFPTEQREREREREKRADTLAKIAMRVAAKINKVMNDIKPSMFTQFFGQIWIVRQFSFVCHRLEHQISNERGADLIRTSLPKGLRDTQATEQTCPDKQFPFRLVFIFCNTFSLYPITLALHMHYFVSVNILQSV